MSDARYEALASALGVQQVLLRTLALATIEREISASSDWEASLRAFVERWHSLIDRDETSSKAPWQDLETDREMARQHVDSLSAIVSIRKQLGL